MIAGSTTPWKIPDARLHTTETENETAPVVLPPPPRTPGGALLSKENVSALENSPDCVSHGAMCTYEATLPAEDDTGYLSSDTTSEEEDDVVPTKEHMAVDRQRCPLPRRTEATRTRDAGALLAAALRVPFLRAAFAWWLEVAHTKAPFHVTLEHRDACSILCRIVETQNAFHVLRSLQQWALVAFSRPARPLEDPQAEESLEGDVMEIMAALHPGSNTLPVRGHIAPQVMPPPVPTRDLAPRSLPTSAPTGVQVGDLNHLSAVAATSEQSARRLVTNARYLNRRSETLLESRSRRGLQQEEGDLPLPPPPDVQAATLVGSPWSQARKSSPPENRPVLRIRPTRASRLRRRAAPGRLQAGMVSKKAPSARPTTQKRGGSDLGSVHYDVATVTVPLGRVTTEDELEGGGVRRSLRDSLRNSNGERLSMLSAMGTTAQTLSKAFKSGVGAVPNVVVHDIYEGQRLRLWDLFSHTLLVLDFYLAMGSARTQFPLVSVDA